MADEQSTIAGRRKSRGSDTSGRADAFKRLKALRSGGRRSDNGGVQIKVENPIYDSVPEDEYDALVAKRREEVKGFIVDDEGLGYCDEGEEEDWSKTGLPLSSDDSEGEKERPKKKKMEKKESQPKKQSSSFSTAAAKMGKQKLSSMFTSSIFKKCGRNDKSKSLVCDTLVDDVIAEFAPDEEDREKRRRGQMNSMQISKNLVPIAAVKSDKPCVRTANPTFIHEVSKVVDIEELKCSKINTNGNSDLVFVQGDLEVKRNGVNEEFKEDKDSSSKFSEDTFEHEHVSPTKESLVKEQDPKMVEIKAEQVAKNGAYTLSAKIREESNPELSAIVGWQAVRSRPNPEVDVIAEIINNTCSEEKCELDLDSNSAMPFYIVDAYEELYGANTGNVYLFGKVKSGGMHHSCCVVVKNMRRCAYAIPKDFIIHSEEMIKLEKDVEESRLSPADLRTKLQEATAGLKKEVSKHLLAFNISSFSMTPVKRKYAFERHDIPSGEIYVLKINYPFKDNPLPSDLKGESFSALLGTHCSALELFLVKRKIKGPSWLSVSKFSTCPTPQQVSWCKFEVTVDSPKDISICSNNTIEIPPIVVAAINLKTIINEKQNANEIVSASVICCHKVKIDTPTLSSEWKRPGMLRHFTVVRKLDGAIFPMGFSKEATDRNSKAGYNVLISESNERALLNRLMIELYKLDIDVLVGHNISGFDLDVLLHRAQACRVRSNMWSKIGRLKRSVMPKLGKGTNIFESRASLGIISCIAGRLLCDTYLCSRDLLKEVSYSLTELSKTQLNKDRKEITPHDIPKMFQTSESLMQLVRP